jgi:hypothetical protein
MERFQIKLELVENRGRQLCLPLFITAGRKVYQRVKEFIHDKT